MIEFARAEAFRTRDRKNQDIKIPISRGDTIAVY